MKRQKTKTVSSIEDLTDLFVQKLGWKKRRFYPVYPLKEGYYSRVAAGMDEPKPKMLTDEKGTRFLERPEDPLTDYQKKLVLYFTQGCGLADVSSLAEFLHENCGVAKPETYDWGHIIASLERYRQRNGILRETVLSFDPIQSRFQFTETEVSFDGVSLKISNKGHRRALQLLVNNFGRTVPFDDIEETLDSPGAENRRQALTALRKALNDLPFEIKSEKKIGARLQRKT